MNMSDLLNEFNPSRGSEVYLRPLTKEISSIALDLLTQFGDTVSEHQLNFIHQCV